MDFKEVIGQEEAQRRLLQMMDGQKVPHAIMLCGPTGCGKMAVALAFASALLKSGSTNTAACEAMLRKWAHPDLHFSFPVIRPTGTSSEHKMVSADFIRQWTAMLEEGPYFSMEQWLQRMDAQNQQAIIFEAESDAITHKLSLKSSQGGWKVCLIWLPERMNAACANKILKILEEPPQMTAFIMVSEQPEKLLDTIRSRVQRIDLKRIDDSEVERALVERRGLEQDMAHRIAHRASGSWLKALELLQADNADNERLELFIQIMRLTYQRNVKGMKAWTETVAAMGRERQLAMIDYFQRMVRENFAYNFGLPQITYMSQQEEAFSRNFARFINEANVIDIADALQKARRDIGQNANAKMVFFDLALQLTIMLRAGQPK